MASRLGRKRHKLQRQFLTTNCRKETTIAEKRCGTRTNTVAFGWIGKFLCLGKLYIVITKHGYSPKEDETARNVSPHKCSFQRPYATVQHFVFLIAVTMLNDASNQLTQFQQQNVFFCITFHTADMVAEKFALASMPACATVRFPLSMSPQSPHYSTRLLKAEQSQMTIAYSDHSIKKRVRHAAIKGVCLGVARPRPVCLNTAAVLFPNNCRQETNERTTGSIDEQISLVPSTFLYREGERLCGFGKLQGAE